MTAPPDVTARLRELLASTTPSEYLGNLYRSDVEQIIAAIEERDARIASKDEAIVEMARLLSPEVKRAAEYLSRNADQHPHACCMKCADSIATLTRQLAEARAKLARYEQAEKKIWDRTPSWLGEQLPMLAAYLVKIETERDAMRGAFGVLRESAHFIVKSGGSLNASWVIDVCDRALGAL